LIFGGGNDDQESYLDERKGRRVINPEQNLNTSMNNNPIVDKNSYYGRDKSQKDHITLKPGEVSRDELVASRSQQAHAVRKHSGAGSSGSASDYFAGGFGANEPQQAARKQFDTASPSSNYFANGMSGRNDQAGDNQPHRTRRMYAPPGGASSFQLA
jgi:hypothetical protein